MSIKLIDIFISNYLIKNLYNLNNDLKTIIHSL